MRVEQISIFLENKPGRLAQVTKTLMEAKINIKALALADTSEFGILRLIVSDPQKACDALKGHHFTVGQSTVVAVEIPHNPGGLNNVLLILENTGVNIEYMYGYPYKSDNAVMIFRFDNIDLGLEVLSKHGFRILASEEVYV